MRLRAEKIFPEQTSDEAALLEAEIQRLLLEKNSLDVTSQNPLINNAAKVSELNRRIATLRLAIEELNRRSK